MNVFPIKYFEENLIFNTSGECWAIYKMKSFNYDYMKNEKKINEIKKLSRFIMSLGYEARIIIIPIKNNNKEHIEGLKERLNKKDSLYKATSIYLNNIKEYLQNLENSIEYFVYICTNLTKKDIEVEGIQGVFNSVLKEPMQVIQDWFGVSDEGILKRKLDFYKTKSTELRSRITKFELIDIGEKEIQWILKRMNFRGIQDEMKLFNYSPKDNAQQEFFNNTEIITPNQGEIINLTTPGMIELKHKRLLKVEHSDGSESWQTFLPMTVIPDNMDFPGCEYIYLSQTFNFPVETVISLTNVENKKAIRNLDKRRREVKGQIEHVGKYDVIPDELVEAMDEADDLESYLKKEMATLVKASITFCISGKTREEVEENAHTFINTYKDNNFCVERPRSDQAKLFMEFWPGVGKYTRDFDLQLTPLVLAAGVFGAVTNIGDNKGFYIGKGGLQNKAVFLDLLYACQLNKPPAAFIAGAQGYGKTFSSNLLVYLHVLNGAKAFIIDPKGDRKDWEKNIPELKEYIEVIEFKAQKADQGKLDPFIIHRNNMDEAGQLAEDIIMEYFGYKRDSLEYTIISEAIKKVKVHKMACMETLYKELKNFEQTEEREEMRLIAMKVSRQLKTLDSPSLQGLLYSHDGLNKGLDFKNRVNILMIQNLKLPGRGVTRKEDYTADERLGTVLMLAIANFAFNFSQSNNAIKKLVVMDESWALMKTAKGRDLFEKLARMGRSLNTACVFIGHSSKDIIYDEGIRNAIRYKFIFNLNNQEEAIDTLNFLNMDVNTENIELVSSDNGLRNGECLFSDVTGRIGRLKFDAVYEHLVKAFTTTPPENMEEGEFLDD